MNSLREILSQSNKDIDNQKLMDYLSNKLSIDEKHEVEKLMIDSDMLNDAVEGLSDFENKKELSTFVEQLNDNLRRQLEKKKKRKDKRKLKDNPWIYLAVIIILLFTILFFILIKKHLDSEKKHSAPFVSGYITLK